MNKWKNRLKLIWWHHSWSLLNVQWYLSSRVTDKLVKSKLQIIVGGFYKARAIKNRFHTQKIHKTIHFIKPNYTKLETAPSISYNSLWKMYFEAMPVYHTDWWQLISRCPCSIHVARWLKTSSFIFWHLIKSENIAHAECVTETLINSSNQLILKMIIQIISFHWPSIA